MGQLECRGCSPAAALREGSATEPWVDLALTRSHRQATESAGYGRWVRAVLLAPGLLWLALFGAAPLVLVLIYSFLRRGPYGEIEPVLTLANYARLLDPLYARILWRSAILSSLATILCLLVAYPLAYAIASAPPRRRHQLLVAVVIPFWSNFLIRTYAWLVILREEGLINAVLQGVGLIQHPLTLLYTPGAVIVGLVYTWLPFAVLPIYASLEKLDPYLVEAARDLGAGGWQVLRRVILPLTLPGLVVATVFVFVPALATFVIPDLMGGATTLLVGNLIKNQFLSARNWPFGSAISVALMLLVLFGLMVASRLAAGRISPWEMGRTGGRRA